MTIASIHPSPSSKTIPTISWEEFEQTYLSREDGYKYEWLNGIVEKTPYAMNKTQIGIFQRLLAAFHRLLFEGKVEGGLIPEADLFFQQHHRRPDVSWLTQPQIDRLEQQKNAYEIPAFVIEVISTNDMIEKVEDKMDDYSAAGVQVVWHIFPKQQKVHIFTGPKLDKRQVCRDKQLCTAAPALPGFVISAAQIFNS